MTEHVIPDWQRRRSELNHDWLKNKFLRHLSAFLKRLSRAHRDTPRVAEFVKQDLEEWESKRREFQLLLEAFESEMSPRNLFGIPPLARMDPATRQWLGDLVHDLWLARWPVRHRLQRGREALAEADEAYSAVHASLRDAEQRRAGLGQPETEEMLEFRNRCLKLADVLGEFPSVIQIV